MSKMETLISEWDGETVITHLDRPTGAWIFIALHSSRLGPATGGTRMRTYPDTTAALGDALKLAAGMTYKFAVSRFERGGGKAVISIPEGMPPDERPDLLRRYGRLIKQLGGSFYTGPDVGTSPDDMDIIAETGAPYVHSLTPAAGGGGSSGPATALGVFTGIQVACEHVYGEVSLKTRKVLVQGVGSVGGKLIEHLLSAGAELSFSEVDDRLVHEFRDKRGLRFVPVDEVYTTACDVFAPCALGAVLNETTISQLKCLVVVGGANNQLASPDDAARLRARGIVYAPDYVVNVGGAMAITGIEAMGWSPSEAENRVIESVRHALVRVLKMAQTENITTEEAALRIAKVNLAELPVSS